MLAFQFTQRGQVPVESVTRAIIEAHRVAVTLLLNEVTKNVSGGVVGVRTGRLRGGLFAKIVARPGEVIGTVGFDKRVGFIARFLERGAKPHDLGKGARTARLAFGRRRASRSRGAFRGERSSVLAIRLGSGLIFRRNAWHPGLQPRPILEAAAETVAPFIREDFKVTIGKALNP
jgi:hypothetical protein